MDHDKLDKILSKDHAPDIDENAKKRALNLAVAEFKAHQNEKNSKKSQGFLNLARLIGNTNPMRGKSKMKTKQKNNKWIYGGMATAMVVVLVGGLSLTQLQDTLQRHETHAETISSNNFAHIASNMSSNISSGPIFDLGKLLPDYTKPNQNARLEHDSKERQAPVDTQAAHSATPEISGEDPLVRWRLLQEERIESAKDDRWSNNAPAASPPSEPELYSGQDKMVVLSDDLEPQVIQQENRNKFEKVTSNPFKQVTAEPVSTFSSDVDTASYAFVRKTLNNGQLPNPDSVRIEEMVNYFTYDYPVPENRAEPFKPTIAVTDSPWAEGRKLMHVGIKGYQLDKAELRSNLVFLLDVSGSMNSSDKLPLVKASMKMLLDSLHPDDTVSIVTYAGSTGVVMPPTKVSQSSTIINAMNNLSAGGGTAGAAGIELAYQQAEQNFSENAINRVILATDGDFNVGITNQDELKRYIERKREKGIFLSVLGFGQGNYNDALMQVLAQNGNGVAAYIDTLSEARKVLVEEASSALFPIAKDVKFQVEFNPAAVSEYRLIGYETRALKREDFNNDKIDAGDMGAGHTVTAIYEFVPTGSNAGTIDPLRYGEKQESIIAPEPANEYGFVKIRYKLPMENTSKLITRAVPIENQGAGPDTAFATAVAAFGQILKGGEYTGNFSYDDVITLAQSGKGEDKFGYRAEFINLVRMAKTLAR